MKKDKTYYIYIIANITNNVLYNSRKIIYIDDLEFNSQGCFCQKK
ncbi:MAG: hypothetical protein U9P70_03145 [Patescibacteria group bacterium]|nr:hypothetical protein [Patescibacteria group bacterium]